MTFLATNILPTEAYNRAKQLAVQVKRLAQARSSEWSSGADASVVLSMVDNMVALKLMLETQAAVSGIGPYAKDQESDQSYDVVAEFNALIAAMGAVITEVVTTHR